MSWQPPSPLSERSHTQAWCELSKTVSSQHSERSQTTRALAQACARDHVSRHTGHPAAACSASEPDLVHALGQLRARHGAPRHKGHRHVIRPPAHDRPAGNLHHPAARIVKLQPGGGVQQQRAERPLVLRGRLEEVVGERGRGGGRRRLEHRARRVPCARSREWRLWHSEIVRRKEATLRPEVAVALGSNGRDLELDLVAGEQDTARVYVSTGHRTVRRGIGTLPLLTELALPSWLPPVGAPYATSVPQTTDCARRPIAERT
eukprot:74870-Rhodomonas_salina.2